MTRKTLKIFSGLTTFSIVAISPLVQTKRSWGDSCKKTFQLLGVAICMLLFCVPAFSQGSAGRILGTVTDQSGGVVAGATVSVVDTARGVTRALTTDNAGEYNAPNLIPGSYVVRVEAKGFKTLERQNVVIQVGQEVRVDLSVQPGDVSQTITVTESIPLVETTNATLGGALDNADITNMPLNGRNMENLLSLRPGIMMQPGGGPWTQSTNGIRPNESVWMVDGIINTNFYDGRQNAGAPGPTTDGATILPIDAIQEFNTMENPKAEYGWRPGAVINVGLKSGTNSLHGSVYGFYRSAAWDARNYFNPAPDSGGTCELNPGSTPNLQAIACGKLPTQLRQYGAVLGGPIIKDKLFFLGGFEALNSFIGNAFPSGGIPQTVAQPVASPGSSMVDAITAAQGAGALSLCSSSVFTSCLSPASLAIAGCTGTSATVGSYTCTGGLFPNNPSTSSVPGPTGYISNFPNTNVSYNGVGKIDYHINDKNTLSGETIIGNYYGIGEDHPYINKLFVDNFIIKTYTASGSWDYSPNSTLVNEVRFGYNRFDYITTTNDTSITIPGLTTGLTVPGLPDISIGSPSGLFAQLGTFHNRPQSNSPNPYYDLQDNISYLNGKHTFKFGVEFAHVEADANVPDFGRGQINFASLTNFFQGLPSGGEALIGNAKRAETFKKIAGFVQDDWRISPKFTLNLGLRYEYTTPWKDTQNLWANFDPNSATGLVQQGQPGMNTIWKPDPKALSPRLGFAWDVKGNGTTVVRGGFSIIYSTLTADTFLNQNQLQNGSDISLAANPTGATLYANGAVRFPGAVGGVAVAAFKSNSSPTAQDWENVVFPNIVQCGDGIAGDPAPCNLLAVDPNLATPRIMNFSLGITHSFGTNMSLEVGYVGNHGSSLTGISDVNACAVSDPTSPTYACVRPYGSRFPWLGTIDEITNDVHSNYNSLQVTFTKRMSHGLSLLAGYTYGHGLDNGSLSCYILLPQNANDPGAEYGNSDYDIRHRLTLTATYNIPGINGFAQLLKGWQVNGILTLQSAQPWVVNDYENNWSGVGDTSDRWSFFGNPSDFKSSRNSIPYCTFSTAGAVNGCSSTNDQSGQSIARPNSIAAPCLTAATAAGSLSSLEANGSSAVAGIVGGCYVVGNSVMIPPAFGHFGNMGRNIFRDSGFRNFDFSIFKNFTFRERYTAQFRLETFNIFNHPNFANPYGANLGTSGAQNDPGSTGLFGGTPGTPDVNAGNPIVGSGGARDLQIGLKLTF
jgi:Carboxypeptidase regulatory-like domain/TonB dependent receptor